MSQISLIWQRGSLGKKIRLAASRKMRLLTQKSCSYLLHRQSYSQFCPDFCCHGNRGCQGRNL